jgi:hypothetical protein
MPTSLGECRAGVVCAKPKRLLTDDVTTPLINSALPAEDVRSRLVQIRSGFHCRD